MPRSICLSLIGALLAFAPLAVLADTPGPPPAPAGLALAVFPAHGGKTLKVSSPAFKDGGDIPIENTQYGRNVFPGLAWSKGPYGTRTFVVIMQDADVKVRGGLLHWSMYDITGRKLEAGMTAPPAGASFGPNMRGPNHAYMGPHTPAGVKHHYHFAVFALDETIPIDPALSYDALAAAMIGHVLASGEVVGLGQAPGPPVVHVTTFPLPPGPAGKP
jgi:para-nitrobenzyl esterase